MYTLYKYFLTIFTILLVPAVALAEITDFRSFVGKILDILGLLIPIIFGLALIFFFWGVAMFIFSAGDEKKREEGKYTLMWGIIILFIMISIWGIIKVLLNTFGFAV